LIGTKWSYAVHYNCNEIGVMGNPLMEVNDTVFDYTVTGTKMVNGEFSYVTQTFIQGEAKRRYGYPGGVAPAMDVPVDINGGTESRSYVTNELTREDESLWINAMGGIDLPVTKGYTYMNYPSDLQVGGTWTYETEVNIPTFAFYENMNWQAQVVGIESITVPLGTFQCYKVESNGTAGMLPDATNHYWWDTDGYLPCPVKYVEDYLFLGTETFELATYVPLREIYDCTFIGNVSLNSGGGMYNEVESSPRVTYSTFDANQATGTDCFGGGMFNHGGSPTLISTILSNNTATDGGGMYNLESQSTMQGCLLAGNTATLLGGGICNIWSNTVLTGCSLNDNNSFNGGGIYNNNSLAVVNSGTFNSNSAANNGGGFNNSFDSSVSLMNCSLTGNSSASGGGLYNSGSYAQVTGCVFMMNSGSPGMGGGIANHSSSSSIINSVFDNNSSDFGGGGVSNLDSDSIINGCNFTNNWASAGGGVSNVGNPSAHIWNCTFTSNQATNGGGIINGAGSFPDVINSVFFGNQADFTGGAIRNFDSTPQIVNCTIYQNSAGLDGGGIINDDASPQIINSILWGNMNNEIADIGVSAPTVIHCDIQVNPGSPAYPGIGNISGTPMFVNPGSGDFHLLPISPCIDSGSNAAITATGVTTDFDGDPRIMNGRVDMGVDETPVGWSPWIYDININGKIDFKEMVDALMDYLLGKITYSQMVEVLMLYLTA